MKIIKIRGRFPVNNRSSINMFKRRIPVLIAVTVKNHFLLGFRRGGRMTDKSRYGWAKRKRNDRGNTRRRAILVKTGALRADIKIRQKTFNRIVVGTRNIEYAIYHNEGTDRLPQREFIGQSRELDRKVINIIKSEIKFLGK